MALLNVSTFDETDDIPNDPLFQSQYFGCCLGSNQPIWIFKISIF